MPENARPALLALPAIPFPSLAARGKPAALLCRSILPSCVINGSNSGAASFPSSSSHPIFDDVQASQRRGHGLGRPRELLEKLLSERILDLGLFRRRGVGGRQLSHQLQSRAG